jgi:hypothetical protein
MNQIIKYKHSVLPGYDFGSLDLFATFRDSGVSSSAVVETPKNSSYWTWHNFHIMLIAVSKRRDYIYPVTRRRVQEGNHKCEVTNIMHNFIELCLSLTCSGLTLKPIFKRHVYKSAVSFSVLSMVSATGVHPPPPEIIPKFWQSLAEFPFPWKIHPMNLIRIRVSPICKFGGTPD